jgi:hypothetical protein
VDFRAIRFGYKSAQAERRRDPALLDEGFYRKDGAVEGLLRGDNFLVLGYKGSGKSAIAEHIDIEARNDPDLFVELLQLRDFPFDDVPQLVPADTSEPVRTNLAWSILLLIKLLESLSKDPRVPGDLHPDYANVTSALQKLGLMPRRRFRDLVLKSREVNLSLALHESFGASIKQTYAESTLSMTHVRDRLQDVVCSASGPIRHVLVLDGLDEVFHDFERHYTTLASLIHEIEAINAALDEANSCAHVIVMCRTDIFERLPSPNVNKLRDFAVVLDWYQNPRQPQHSKLFELATHRARLSGYRGENLLLDYLPGTLQRKRGNGVNTFRFLLEHTRHTPRDFLQLLTHIQREARPGGNPSERAVFDGLRRYSIDYFLPELKDELGGYFDPPEVHECFQMIGGLRKREFSFAELADYAKSMRLGSRLDIREAIRVLFDCSAVGNVVYRPRPGGGSGTYFTFRNRNRNASVNLSEPLILHRGVWKALNLV